MMKETFVLKPLDSYLRDNINKKIDSFLSEHSEEIKKASLTENAADEERKSSGYNSGWER